MCLTWPCFHYFQGLEEAILKENRLENVSEPSKYHTSEENVAHGLAHAHKQAREPYRDSCLVGLHAQALPTRQTKTLTGHACGCKHASKGMRWGL